MIVRALILAGLLLSVGTFGAGAQTAAPGQAGSAPSRCAILGQMVVSVWADTIAALGADDRAATEDSVMRLDRISAIYAHLNCDVSALSKALDCVIDAPVTSTADARLLTCIRQSGLTSGG